MEHYCRKVGWQHYRGFRNDSLLWGRLTNHVFSVGHNVLPQHNVVLNSRPISRTVGLRKEGSASIFPHLLQPARIVNRVDGKGTLYIFVVSEGTLWTGVYVG